MVDTNQLEFNICQGCFHAVEGVRQKKGKNIKKKRGKRRILSSHNWEKPKRNGNQKQMTFNKNHSPVCMPLLLQRNGTAVSSSIILSLQAAKLELWLHITYTSILAKYSDTIITYKKKTSFPSWHQQDKIYH